MRIAKPNILMLSLVGGFSIAFVLGVIMPGHRRLATAQGQTRQIESEMMAAAARIFAVDSVAAEVNALRERAAAFDQSIPVDPNLGAFLGELTSILERNRMDNHILQPRPARKLSAQELPVFDSTRVGAVMEQPILVQCDGGCESWFTVLRELESARRLTRLERLKLSADPEHPGRIKVDASISVFYRTAHRAGGGA